MHMHIHTHTCTETPIKQEPTELGDVDLRGIEATQRPQTRRGASPYHRPKGGGRCCTCLANLNPIGISKHRAMAKLNSAKGQNLSNGVDARKGGEFTHNEEGIAQKDKGEDAIAE